MEIFVLYFKFWSMKTLLITYLRFSGSQVQAQSWTAFWKLICIVNIEGLPSWTPVLHSSGNNDLLVISSIQVLLLLARSEEKFKEKLAIGFSTLLPVLHYVAEIPFHPVQSHVLQLVWICMVNCSGILSLPQEEQIACTLTAILRSLLYFLYCMPVHSTMKGTHLPQILIRQL